MIEVDNKNDIIFIYKAINIKSKSIKLNNKLEKALKNNKK